MSTTDSGFRLFGAVAALAGLVVMMCAPSPSPSSLGWGLAGLGVFCACRLVWRGHPVARPKPVPATVVLPPPKEAVASSLHPSLAQPIRVGARSKPPSFSKVTLGPERWSAPIPSSVLPPSRVGRGSTSPDARSGS